MKALIFKTQPWSTSILIKQFAPGIVEVNGLDFDFREKGVCVHKDRATSMVGYVEPIREKIMVNIFNRLLQGDNVSFS